ncbi:MAG: sensor histidine kinase [Myxococcota bacterium]
MDQQDARRLGLEGFFDNSPDLMALLDRDLRIIRANPAFVKTLGEHQGRRSVLDIVAPRDREKTRSALVQCLAGGTRTFDAAVVRPSQAIRQGEWVVSAAQDSVAVVIRDVTARRRLEKELLQAQKLEAVGRLASGIAHEINTPIQFVGDNLTFIGEVMSDVLALLKDLAGRPDGSELLGRHSLELEFLETELPSSVDQAREGVQRVAEIVRGMKEFAHQDAGEYAPTDLNRALERTITVARSEWKYAADLVTDYGELPTIKAQASALRQVFLNLICNAAQAIAERNRKDGRRKGLIKVRTRVERDSVVVSVEDDGGGIPDAVRARLFEPFFTTKPVGHGTGQGLAISRAIVRDKHGGRLDFESTVGVGTTFFVRLPIKTEAEKHAEAA